MITIHDIKRAWSASTDEEKLQAFIKAIKERDEARESEREARKLVELHLELNAIKKQIKELVK